MYEELNILYAEDEDFIRENVLEILDIMSIKVTAAKDGQEAYELYNKIKPNVVIADIEMPNMNGLELAEKIREKDLDTQIIITTAYTNTEYFVKAVELHLLKYLIKPITLVDINEVLKKCLKNLKNTTNSLKFFNDTTYFNMNTHELVSNEEIIKLDFKESRLLELLLKNHNHAVTYEEIENKVWDGEYMSSLALRTLISNLRKKLPKDSITNLSKTGYLIKIN